jgi:carbamoyl-phosphate synthase large subunit
MKHEAKIRKELSNPGPDRVWYVGDAFRFGMSVDEVYRLSGIDPLVPGADRRHHQEPKIRSSSSVLAVSIATRSGVSSARASPMRAWRLLIGVSEKELRKKRWELGVKPVYKRVDTCAAEFATSTAYMYSTYEEECEANPSSRDKIMVLGGGP